MLPSVFTFANNKITEFATPLRSADQCSVFVHCNDRIGKDVKNGFCTVFKLKQSIEMHNSCALGNVATEETSNLQKEAYKQKYFFVLPG